MKYFSKDNNYSDGSTTYWFEVEESAAEYLSTINALAGDVYGISDCSGFLTVVDDESYPIGGNEFVCDYLLSNCVITDEIKNHD